MRTDIPLKLTANKIAKKLTFIHVGQQVLLITTLIVNVRKVYNEFSSYIKLNKEMMHH